MSVYLVYSMDMQNTQHLATEAAANVINYRADFNAAKTSKARREAAENLDFWIGKAAALQHSLELDI